jgi:hypothetical protein
VTFDASVAGGASSWQWTFPDAWAPAGALATEWTTRGLLRLLAAVRSGLPRHFCRHRLRSGETLIVKCRVAVPEALVAVMAIG